MFQPCYSSNNLPLPLKSHRDSMRFPRTVAHRGGGLSKGATVMDETWLPVIGFEGFYEVSSAGRIRSAAARTSNTFDGKIIKQNLKPSGYWNICLHKNRTQHTLRVHRVVAEAFLDNTDGLSQVNHKDGDKSNNAVLNLEWCSAGDNMRHAISLGLKPVLHGEAHGNAKLTDEKVRSIIADHRSGEKQISIARKYSVTRATVCLVVNRKIWRHVEIIPHSEREVLELAGLPWTERKDRK